MRGREGGRSDDVSCVVEAGGDGLRERCEAMEEGMTGRCLLEEEMLVAGLPKVHNC